MRALAQGDPGHKGFTEGTHRLRTPEETLARVCPHMARMGITRIAQVTGLDRIGVPVVTVCRPNSRSLSVSQGKGLSLAAAKASGLMESVECYHAERVSHPLRVASYRALQSSANVVDVDRLPRVARGPFTAQLEIPWVEGLDLLTGQRTYVPYELVHTDFTVPPAPGSGCFPSCSNGLASGNHLLEAISHGICEVVERDALTLWELGAGATDGQTRLDLGSISDPACRALLDQFSMAEVLPFAWDLTSDVGIPTCSCTIIDAEADPLLRMYAASGFGCHPSREIALIRAITEAAQSRLAGISGARDDLLRGVYDFHRDPERIRRRREALQAVSGRRPFGLLPVVAHETFEQDVAWQLERLRAVGVEQVICVDLSLAELEIPVVRVVIPGLECAAIFRGTYTLGPRARAVRGQPG